MNAILQVIASVLSSLLVWLHGWSRSGVDGDRDDGRIRRAGSRIRQWMQPRRADPGIKPEANRTIGGRQDLHDAGRQMDAVRQSGGDS